ncbi:zinc finger-containing ubiquitin peptidase 1 isoform X4 [Kryptolebias marmoratus]|uniref:zinc finger-containing ubiquitin peptidase 1 isoform X4 n=1 Tax=Kryptolebias marmoratus TaxID=37003 RepID=UPI000D52F322|nr:zinc finger-containing ubiquitin peptidase 1 isoform X4 [Kryptolebias marmoratus]
MHEVDSEHSKAELLFPCPLCSLVCSSPVILQEHVELHLQGHLSDQGERRFECPMCSTVCSDSFSLQEHVELHLNQSSDPDPDLKLALQLQQKEELRRQQEEVQQEEEEFKKLQRQFGLAGEGGYRRQTERSMEKAVAQGLLTPADFHWKRAEMMESLASGVDDGATRSQDKVVPCIPRIQSMIEEAWKEGLDPQGASHFNQRLQGTRAWIGATEIYVLLTSLGISSRIIDFHKPTGTADTHPLLFDWVKQYFCQTSRSSRLPNKIIQTGLPPLYLQHQGHSRSVVGFEQKKNGSFCLLLLDPGSSMSDIRKLLSRDTWTTAVRLIRKFPRNLKHRQYQLVSVQGVLSAEDKQIKILSSSTLRAERIP